MQVSNSNHVNISGCNAHDSGGGGIVVTHSDYISLYSDVTYNNSYTSPNQTSGISIGFGTNSDTLPGVHNVVAQNVSYGNIDKVPVPTGSQAGYTTDGNGIVIDTLDNTGAPNAVPFVGQTVVENNIVFNNGGRGIAVFHSSNVIVRNNTAYNNLQDPQFNQTKPAGEFSENGGSNNQFYNNVAYVTGNTAIHYAFVDVYSPGGDVFDYNIGYGGNTKYLFNYGSTGSVFGSHNIVGQNPSFAPGKFFQLQAGSPALASGTFANTPAVDYLGVVRPTNGPIDRGAYQLSH
jgi:parallel beta-helix repeat protein